MKEDILQHISNARQLEKLYRSDKSQFAKEFLALPAELRLTPLGEFWTERLSYEADELSWGSRTDLLFVIVAAIIAGSLAKLPHLLNIDEEFFYPRNIGFIVFPVFMAYFSWKNKLALKNVLIIVGACLTSLVFINLFPAKESDTLILSCIHLALLLWAIVGFAFVGDIKNNVQKRLAYLKFNGDLVVITALICITAGIMTGVTIGLFSVIGLHIEEFWFQNVVVFGLPAAPIMGMFLINANPHLVGKVSPVIAKLFSPLVLVMLIVYLVAMMYSGKDPYRDREFLLIFNALLIGVMAIIFFSIAETSRNRSTRAEITVLLLLSIATIVVNGIALSAILFRISEWGFTPNRTAILGGNVLILIHLLLVALQLFKAWSAPDGLTSVGKTIASYLPVYVIWAIVVVFVFPLIFGFQ
ncbi:MAG TPA: hypothetical protein VGD65_04070 [Chryseosolibacter sp.]